MDYRISDSHPVPAIETRWRKAKYPFAKLKIGESFTVPADEALSARRAAHQFGKRHGQKFATRGARIWRVS